MKTLRTGSALALATAAVLLFISCSRSGSGNAAQGKGEYDNLVLGKVAGKEYTVADLQKKLKYQFGAVGEVNNASAVEQAREILKGAVDELCWVRLGEKKGYQNEAQFKDTWELSRRYILADRVIDHEVRSKETPSDDEVRTYYNEHQSEFTAPTRVQIAHVLSRTEPEAKAIRARLLKGEPVAELAQKLSIDEPTKNNGGVLGWVTPTSGGGHLGNLPQLNEAAVRLKKGEVSQPVEIPAGWTVMVAMDRQEAQVVPLEGPAMEAARKKVQTKKHNMLFKETLDRLKTEYDAEIYMDNFDKYARSILPEDELFTAAQREKDTDRRLGDYEEIVRRFPTGRRAPQAQFMIGFIKADERKDYPAARKAFQTFIEKYPDSDLVSSARWMIDNMEKPEVDHSSVDQIGRQARFGH